MSISGEDALEQAKSYLGSVLRIRISDGRLIQGDFQCMDSDLNFILGNAIEYHGVEDGMFILFMSPLFKSDSIVAFVKAKSPDLDKVTTITRNLGMAMVPGKHVVQILAAKRDFV